MAIEVTVRVVPGGLAVANTAEGSKLERLLGKEVQAKISIPRNLGHHRKFFALLHVLREMADTTFNPEQFRAVCLVGSGWCDFVDSNGSMVAVPRSISFSSMDEAEFQNLYSDVLDWGISNWVLDREQIDQILTFM